MAVPLISSLIPIADRLLGERSIEAATQVTTKAQEAQQIKNMFATAENSMANANMEQNFNLFTQNQQTIRSIMNKHQDLLTNITGDAMDLMKKAADKLAHSATV